MKILVSNQQKDLSIRVHSAKALIKDFFANEHFVTDEVSVHFVSLSKICELHQIFFNDPNPTDCISFPLDRDGDTQSGYHVIGEVFVCPQIAIRYLLHHPEALCPYHETTLYLVHGLLHLIGYDDQTSIDQKKMKRAEKRHMEHLVNKNLLLKPISRNNVIN